MRRKLLSLSLALAISCAATLAHAQWKDGEEPPMPDAARPAIGTWIGHVSWNDFPVTYAWDIFPGGVFGSGRLGRGDGGGGHWSADGAHLSLKYESGFRYDGDISEDVYSGTASLPNGRRFGSFYMSRAQKSAPPEEDH
jgi:hypothetical protein